MSKWTSRKFLLALFDAIFIILNEGLELGVPPEAYAWITGIIIAYITAEGARDLKKA